MPRWLTGAVVLAALQMSVAAESLCEHSSKDECCNSEFCTWVNARYSIPFFWWIVPVPGCGLRSEFRDQTSKCSCEKLLWDECCQNGNFEQCKWVDGSCVNDADEGENTCHYQACLLHQRSTNKTRCCNDDEAKMCGWNGLCFQDLSGEKEGCDDDL